MPPSTATRSPRSRYKTRCSETPKSRQTEPRRREASPRPPSTSPGLLPWPVPDHSQVHRTSEPPQPRLARPSPAAPGSALHRTTCIAAPQPSGPAQLLPPACPSHLPSNPSRQHRARPPNTPSRQHPGPSAPTFGAAAGASVSSSGVAVEGLREPVQRWVGPGADPPREVTWSRCCGPHSKEESKYH